MTPSVPIIRGASFPSEAFTQDFVTNTFLGRHFMFLNRPEGVHRVLVENPGNYVRPQAAFRILDPPIGGGLFLSEGAEWRRQRALFAPSFTPRAVPQFASHVAREAGALVADLAAAEPAAIDLMAPLQKLTLAITAVALFSIDMREHGAAIRDLAAYYTERLGRPTMLDYLLPRFIPGPRDVARWRFRRRWTRLIARVIADRRRQTVATRDLFDVLAATEEERRLLVQQVATMLVTGSETTGAAAFWSVYLLASSPEIQDRVAAEAASVDLGPEEAAASLPQLVYTRAVVQEAMRLYPPALSIVRQALEDDVADGVPIPKGAIVQLAPWVLHRHTRLWSEPSVFDPRRFLPGAPTPVRGAYIPFGLGPRACIGAQFALVEAVLVLAILTRAFRIAPTTDEPVRPVARITLQPDNPAPFRLEPRNGAGSRDQLAA